MAANDGDLDKILDKNFKKSNYNQYVQKFQSEHK